MDYERENLDLDIISGLIKNLSYLKLCNVKRCFKKVKQARNNSGIICLSKGMLFKPFTEYSSRVRNFKALHNFRMINELLITKLCKQLGLESVEYLPYKFGNSIGLASQNFLRPDEKEMKTNFESMQHALTCLNIHNVLGEKVDIQAVEEKLFKLVLLDLFTLQSDRHSGNVVFLKNKKDGKIRMAPIFDCEYAFNIDKFSFSKQCREQVDQIFDDNCQIDVKNVIDIYDESMTEFENGYYGFACLTAYPILKSNRTFEERVKDCVLYSKDNNHLQKHILSFTQKLDIQKAFSDLDKEGVKVSPYYIKYTSSIVDYVKKKVNETLQSCQVIGEYN